MVGTPGLNMKLVRDMSSIQCRLQSFKPITASAGSGWMIDGKPALIGWFPTNPWAAFFALQVDSASVRNQDLDSGSWNKLFL